MLFVTENITTVYTPDGDQPDTSTGQTALEEIYNQADGDRAFVSRPNRYYKWDAAATDAPDGVAVVIPKGYDSAQDAGRWFREGPPGEGGNRIPSGALSAVGRAHVLMRIREQVGNGGSPVESFTVNLDTADFVFDGTTAIAVGNADVPTTAPVLFIRVSCVVRNNQVSVYVESEGGGNLPANTNVEVWVLRRDDRIANPSYTVS